MPNVFLSSVEAPPPPPVEPVAFPGMREMTWVGWDGVEWDLLNPGGVFLTSGVRGLGAPEHVAYRNASPAVHGARYLGSRVTERECFWPLIVWSDQSSADWLEVDRAFWRSMHPDREGVWTVTQWDGSARCLRLRYDGDGGHQIDADPSYVGWDLYGIRTIADQPFWEATKPIVRRWDQTTAPQKFRSGSLFYISSGLTLDSAQIDNPGDEPAWPKWRITGPTTSVSVGLAGRLITVPFPIAAGQWLDIDTSPTEQSALMSTGVDRTPDLGVADFAPIAPGAEVHLSLAMVGTGVVEASITPLYRRAW